MVKTTSKTTKTNGKEVKTNTKLIKFKVWVRNKETKQLEEIIMEAEKLSDIAKAVRTEGKYSFRTAAVPEKFDEAKEKWIVMNQKSIEYHMAKGNSKKAEKMKRVIELIEPLNKKSKEELYEILKLNAYVTEK